MAERTGRVVETALDSLPYGDYTAENIGGRKEKKAIKLPEGLTSRRLMRDVIIIAGPSLVELILTQLTSMADQVMVGRMAGEAGVLALGAVGLAAQPKFLLMTMIQAMNVGTTALIARFRGQQNRERANLAFMQGLLLNVVMAFFFMGVGLVFGEQLIHFISGSGVSEAMLEQAVIYLNINMLGFVPVALTFTMTAALRGVGDTTIPLFYNTVANVVNLFFNYIMIYGKLGCPAMGVAGAAWATNIGQLVAFLIAVFVLTRKVSYIRITFKGFKPDWDILKNSVNIGLPSMIEQLIMRAGMIIFTRAVSGLGDTLYATHQVCMSIQSMSFMMGQAFATATTTLMGQSLGKRRYDMAVLYTRETQKLGLAVSFVLMAVLIVFGKQLVGIYNKTPEVMEVGGKVLLMVAFTQPLQSAQFIVNGGMRGAGDTKFSAYVTLITVFFVRAGLVVLLVTVLDFGIWGAWIAIAADQVVRTIIMLVRYDNGKWAKMGLSQARFKSAPAEAK